MTEFLSDKSATEIEYGSRGYEPKLLTSELQSQVLARACVDTLSLLKVLLLCTHLQNGCLAISIRGFLMSYLAAVLCCWTCLPGCSIQIWTGYEGNSCLPELPRAYILYYCTNKTSPYLFYTLILVLMIKLFVCW